MVRRKALIIGINYYGTQHELGGCINDARNVREFLVEDRGFSPYEHDMVLMTDDPRNYGTPFWPSGANMLAAFNWLTSWNQPGDLLWLSYSGHGGQVRDDRRATGFDDTICPVDFQQNGQIPSEVLHSAIVSPMHPGARLTILFDCCHSGSACELPFVFRPDEDGKINMVDTIRRGIGLVRQAEHLLQGGFSMQAVGDARMLLGGATDFFNGLHHRGGRGPGGGGGGAATDEDGLAAEDDFGYQWRDEGKDVWMFSGCRDDQTSADTSIAGTATGAMSWAFINTLRQYPDQSYVNILQNTRAHLVNRYSQVPQLSCGGRYHLEQRLIL